MTTSVSTPSRRRRTRITPPWETASTSPPGTSRAALDQRSEGTDLNVLLVLEAGWPAVLVEVIRPARVDLGPGQALPLAGMVLAQPLVELDRADPELAGDDLGGAPGPLEVAGDDEVERARVARRLVRLRLARARSAAGRPDPANGARRSTSTGRGGAAGSE